MSSNVQTQINDLNAAVQALDSSLTQITGNTMSNYNQLSRIVSQQSNIYNSVYYGSGNIVTGNLFVNANCNISGNLVIANGNANINGSLLSNGISTFLGQSPFKIQYGEVVIGVIASGTFGSATVTFNSPYISNPTVVATPVGGTTNSSWIILNNQISPTSVVIGARNTSSGSTLSTFSVSWMAIGI